MAVYIAKNDKLKGQLDLQKKMSKCMHAKFHYKCKFEVDNQIIISNNVYQSNA